MIDVGFAPAREVGPGGAIRFAVGSLTGPRSPTWRVWSAKNTADVYLAPRKNAGTAKISLHESGSWSDSYIKVEDARRWYGPDASRHIDLWQRPPDLHAGLTRGYTVIVPRTELRPWHEVEEGTLYSPRIQVTASGSASRSFSWPLAPVDKLTSVKCSSLAG